MDSKNRSFLFSIFFLDSFPLSFSFPLCNLKVVDAAGWHSFTSFLCPDCGDEITELALPISLNDVAVSLMPL